MGDHERVTQLLGRSPQGAFDVLVRDSSGDPVVVRNAPFLADGTPMPTRYYLVGAELVRAVSRLEAAGGVRDAETAIDPAEIAAAHERYAAERDAAIADDHRGPRPSGGVGGTRTGVKCLHAHVAHSLAGGDDPVGRWTLDRLDPRLVAGLVRIDEHGGARSSDVTPGTATVWIDDRCTVVQAATGAPIEMPVGPVALMDGPLRGSDPPTPMDLTNALGLVHDHLDDAIIAAPAIAAASRVVAAGDHALAMARVEIGDDSIPAGYTLSRADAEDVFRTLAVEPRGDRRCNPGLDAAHVESIIGTCCVILGLMRRLELRELAISTDERPAALPADEVTG